MSTFVSSQDSEDKKIDYDEYNKILNSIVGVLPDTGKLLEDYRDEKMAERYGFAN